MSTLIAKELQSYSNDSTGMLLSLSFCLTVTTSFVRIFIMRKA